MAVDITGDGPQTGSASGGTPSPFREVANATIGGRFPVDRGRPALRADRRMLAWARDRPW